jgi:hypothetical protein
VTALSSPTGSAPVKGSRRELAERVRLGEGILVEGSASIGGAPSAANRRHPAAALGSTASACGGTAHRGARAADGLGARQGSTAALNRARKGGAGWRARLGLSDGGTGLAGHGGCWPGPDGL